MRNPNLVPYEIIVRATNGEPDEVLRQRIRLPRKNWKPPGISRHRESKSCQRPKPYKRRLNSLQKRRIRFTTSTGRRKQASENCRPSRAILTKYCAGSRNRERGGRMNGKRPYMDYRLYRADRKHCTECGRLQNTGQRIVDLRLALSTLQEMTDIKELTPTLVNSLIERIEVHNSDKSSGHSYVKVDIYFTAVGMIDIPTEKEILATMEEIRNNPQDFKFAA